MSTETMTIFEALRVDHDTQRDLVDRLTETEGDSGERRQLFAELRAALEDHAAAEERFFYVPLMEHDASQSQARHSVAEHKELDDYLEALAEMDMSSPGWLQQARTLADRLLHHLEEEEVEVFPVAGRVLDDDTKAELASGYRDDMERRQSDA